MKKILLAIFAQLIFVTASIASPSPSLVKISEKKIILNTIAGDIVLALYEDIAPQHVDQLLKLTEAGVLNGTHFYRIHSNFVAQTSSAEDRFMPLTAEQSDLIKEIPAEFSDLPHRKGVLSMAREDGDINSAKTSFSILLGDAPHLDGKYTVFGHIVAGHDVLNEFLKVPQEKLYRPDTRLTIISARVTSENMNNILESRTKAHRILVPMKENISRVKDLNINSKDLEPSPIAISLFGLGTACVLNAVACLFYWFSPSVRIPLSLTLLGTLCGYFCFVIVASPIGQREPLIALGIFAGMVAIFKLLSLFDRPDPVQN